MFIVTHSPREVNGERVVTTDVWRIFSEAKGSALFHNKALDKIVEYYREKLGLTLVYVFSDGCRAQYKGAKNFQKIAQFPSQMHGVKLVHRFAASHHFKGPHDAYGKDAKHLCRAAERSGKARLASTHDIYFFCANTLPMPRHGIRADQLVAALDDVPPPAVASEAEQAAAYVALDAATTHEAAKEVAERMLAAGIQLPPSWSQLLAEAVEAEQEAEAAETAEAMETETMEATEAMAEAVEAAGAEAEEAAFAEEQMGDEEVEEVECPTIPPSVEEATAATRAAELDAEEESPEMGDILFDENGGACASDAEEEDGEAAREASAEPSAGEVAATAAAEAVGAMAVAGLSDPPRKRAKRAARTRTILTQAPGLEASAEGESRTETEQPRGARMFTASNYFWLYFAVEPATGLVKVAVNGGSGPHGSAATGECHDVIDNAEDVDADSIHGSNSTYDFAGLTRERPEDLFTRTYSCSCPPCRDVSAISSEYSECHYMSTVGKWRLSACRSDKGVQQQRLEQIKDVATFAKEIKPETLYGAFGAYAEVPSLDRWSNPTHSLLALSPLLLALTSTAGSSPAHSTAWRARLLAPPLQVQGQNEKEANQGAGRANDQGWHTRGRGAVVPLNL